MTESRSVREGRRERQWFWGCPALFSSSSCKHVDGTTPNPWPQSGDQHLKGSFPQVPDHPSLYQNLAIQLGIVQKYVAFIQSKAVTQPGPCDFEEFKCRAFKYQMEIPIDFSGIIHNMNNDHLYQTSVCCWSITDFSLCLCVMINHN